MPSTFGGRVSRRTTCACCSCSSAASSIVTMRSRSEMNDDSTFSSVVLPAPVPPLTRMLSLASTQCRRNSSMFGASALKATRSSACRRSAGKRRIESSGPSTASGGMIALTREPSGRRASTIGELSSMRRPTPLTMRSMTRSRCCIVLKRGRHLFELARALDEHLLVRIDQDVADRLVAEQRLQRSEAEDFVDDVAENRVALGNRQRHAGFGDERRDERPDLRFDACCARRSRASRGSASSAACDARCRALPGTVPGARRHRVGAHGVLRQGVGPGSGRAGGLTITGVAMS